MIRNSAERKNGSVELAKSPIARDGRCSDRSLNARARVCVRNMLCELYILISLSAFFFAPEQARQLTFVWYSSGECVIEFDRF